MRATGSCHYSCQCRGFVFLRADESWKRIFKNLSLGMAGSVMDLCGIDHGTSATGRPWLSCDFSSVYHNSLCEKNPGFHGGGGGLPLVGGLPFAHPFSGFDWQAC